MTAGVHRVVGFEDFPLFVDEVTDTLGIAGLHVITRSVCEPYCTLRIAEKKKGELELLRERRILFDSIKTDSEDFHVLSAKVSNLVAEPTTLGGSARGVRLGIEPQQNFFPSAIRQRNFLPLMREEGKIGSYISGFQHTPVPPL
jgi:hypothetical protein